MKTCSKCDALKQEHEFYKGRNDCKECCRNRNAKWRKENPKPKREPKIRKAGYQKLPEGMRKCSRCEEVKGVKFFYKDSSRASGTSAYCKECVAVRTSERRERLGEDFLTTRREWTKRNRDRIREIDRAWVEENRERRNLAEARRRARKKSLPDTLTPEEQQEILDTFSYSCVICEEAYEHMDHFIPLFSGHGGTTKENMIPMCSECNMSKGAKNPFEWAKTLTQKDRERFDSLVEYLTELNGIAAVEDYEAHVYQCFN